MNKYELAIELMNLLKTQLHLANVASQLMLPLYTVDILIFKLAVILASGSSRW